MIAIEMVLLWLLVVGTILFIPLFCYMMAKIYLMIKDGTNQRR